MFKPSSIMMMPLGLGVKANIEIHSVAVGYQNTLLLREVLVMLLIGVLAPLVHTQSVTVTLLPVSTVQGQSATLTCTFSLDVPGALDNVEWSQRGTIIADFFGGAQTPTYQNGFAAPGYVASRDNSMSTLMIASTRFSTDDGEYACWVAYTEGGDEFEGGANSHLMVYVLPGSITLSDSTGSYPSTGGKAYLVEGVDRQFTCEVPGINPGASFSWSLDGRTITPDNTLNVTGADNLTTSTSLATVSPAWSSHGEMLQCQASNKYGHAGMSINVRLDVKVPPKTSSMSMYDSNGAFTPGDPVRVDQDASRTFTCLAKSRPAATMQWDVGSASYQESIIGPTNPDPGDGLVNTTKTWTFTPRRDNHRQEVKCVANTAESQQPYPLVMVMLEVNGPPDTPVIIGSASMTENVTTARACSADMGYPDDWTLVWSIGDSPITGPDTTSSPSVYRYVFSSRLYYTPRREDNRNIITCRANRAPWIPGPVGSLGQIDVKFCTLGVIVDMEPDPVNEGNPATWKCRSESSNPATEWTWSINGIEQSTSPQVVLSDGIHNGQVSTATFATGSLSKKDNGAVLMCCANKTTQCSADLCSTSVLNVRYDPEFKPLVQPPNPILEGGEVMLTCSVDANPLPPDGITWEKRGPGMAPTPDMSVYNDGTSNLTLRIIGRDQAGNYSCTANNGIPNPDGGFDVVSPEVTVIVHYEVNITSKEMNEVGVNDGDNAILTCIVVGNPVPVTMWYGPNNTEITNEEDRRNVTTETIGGDSVYGLIVSSNLTIGAVNSQVDYGVYTCISSNGIGGNDSLEITLTGTRRPDKPTSVEITEQTAASLTVTWTPGYDGGETQSFRVSCIKTSDSTEVFTEETGGKTTSTATGLDDYTEYEIRVYAKNAIGESIGYGSTTGYTLPAAPGPDSGITVEFNKDEDTVKVEGLEENACIQLEVQYQGNDTWQQCGNCITSDQTVTLSEWCVSSQKRRRRAVGVIEAVRSRLCIGGFCSEPADVGIVAKPTDAPIALIVGASVGGVALVTIIVVLVVYLVRTSPMKRSGNEDSLSCANEVELQEPSHDAQPEENNGITNEALLNNVDEEIPKKKPEKNEEPDAEPTEEDGLEADTTKGPIPVKRYTVDSGDTYAQVNKTKLPPKPQSARSAPTNLPDVTYAEVNKDKKPKPPHDDYAAKKKPKKYVPPSSRAAEESAYEEVQISDKDKSKSPPAADSADTYASVGGQQDTSGRVVTEDGLIYAEVGHMKQHPVDQPPIQTEESTEYASLDFARMKPEDK